MDTKNINYDFPEFTSFSSSYRYSDDEENKLPITYKIEKNPYDIDFNTFLDKYKIYTDMLWIKNTNFKELYEYLHFHYGDGVYGLDSLYYNGIEPLQKLLDEYSISNIPLTSELELKYYPELLKYFEEYIVDKRDNDELEEIDGIFLAEVAPTLLEFKVSEIYENAQILIFVMFIVFLNFSLEIVLNNYDEEYKQFTRILDRIYNNMYGGIDYKTIYKNIHLPFEINVYDLLTFIDSCKCYDEDSDIYKSIEKENNKWIHKMMDKLNECKLISTDDEDE